MLKPVCVFIIRFIHKNRENSEAFEMIKQITRLEIPECVRVIKESFLTVADEFNITAENAPRFTAFAMNEERLYWQYDNEHRQMTSYYENDKIVGYYSLLQLDDKICELNNLCVLPTYRHKKIGKQLLENAILQAKKFKCQKMTIGFVEENEILCEWYKKFGFNHISTKKFDFFPFTCGYMELEL